MINEKTPVTESGKPGKEFDYCFWSKLLVAVPAIPLIALMAASFFSNMLVQSMAAGLAVGSVIYLAIKIDRIPCLATKVVKHKE